MRTIVEILGKTDKPKRTYALLDGGNGDTVFTGYGHDFEVNDKVMSFYHAQWDTLKMAKPKTPKNTKKS